MNGDGLIGLFRRKPVPFVLGATLVPASVCTLLAVFIPKVPWPRAETTFTPFCSLR